MVLTENNASFSHNEESRPETFSFSSWNLGKRNMKNLQLEI